MAWIWYKDTPRSSNYSYNVMYILIFDYNYLL